MANADPILSVREFEDGMNSFYLHFVTSTGAYRQGDVYRSQPPYIACMLANPDSFGQLADRLRRFYANRKGDGEHAWQGLYEAYRMMHPHAESNDDLFR